MLASCGHRHCVHGPALQAGRRTVRRRRGGNLGAAGRLQRTIRYACTADFRRSERARIPGFNRHGPGSRLAGHDRPPTYGQPAAPAPDYGQVPVPQYGQPEAPAPQYGQVPPMPRNAGDESATPSEHTDSRRRQCPETLARPVTDIDELPVKKFPAIDDERGYSTRVGHRRARHCRAGTCIQSTTSSVIHRQRSAKAYATPPAPTSTTAVAACRRLHRHESHAIRPVLAQRICVAAFLCPGFHTTVCGEPDLDDMHHAAQNVRRCNCT